MSPRVSAVRPFGAGRAIASNRRRARDDMPMVCPIVPRARRAAVAGSSSTSAARTCARLLDGRHVVAWIDVAGAHALVVRDVQLDDLSADLGADLDHPRLDERVVGRDHTARVPPPGDAGRRRGRSPTRCRRGDSVVAPVMAAATPPRARDRPVVGEPWPSRSAGSAPQRRLKIENNDNSTVSSSDTSRLVASGK